MCLEVLSKLVFCMHHRWFDFIYYQSWTHRVSHTLSPQKGVDPEDRDIYQADGHAPRDAFVGQGCKGASTTLLDKSDISFYKLFMFTFGKWCYLDSELCKMIYEAVKLVVCHYYLNFEAALVIVCKCSLE